MAMHRITLAVLVLAAGAAAYGGVRAQLRSRPPPSVLDAVPRTAFLVITIDAAALRDSPFAPTFGGAALSRRVPGIDAVSSACGFDPMARVTELAFAIPEASEHGDFGVIARGDFHRDELAKCAEAMIATRGGRARVGARGAFTTVDDDGADALDAPRLAYSDSGLLLVGRGGWLAEMIDTAEGRDVSVLANTSHASLRSALESTDAAHPRSIVATAILPGPLRARLRKELGLELLSAGDVAQSSLTMNGVLSVGLAGVAITAGARGGQTEIVAELRCEAADACAEVAKLIERKRASFAKDVRMRMVGLGQLFEGMEVHADGARVEVTLRAPADDVAHVVERLLQLAEGGGRAALRPAPPPLPSAPPRLPDEILGAGRDGGPPSPHPSYK